MLHSGHVAFFEEAAQYGELFVGIGSDKTIFDLKARKTINSDAERLYMVKSLKVVKDAWINRGSGLLDFLTELETLKPDIFFVNADGHTLAKEMLCKKYDIEYVVSKRVPHDNLPPRSTTSLRKECNIPYRIDLAGGWLDQPYVSKHACGSVLTLCIEPDYEFNDRSGMSTSSRKKAIELWQSDVPEGDKEKLARMLFCFENPPGTTYISGSQDSLGITMPGLNNYYYDGDFWPSKIQSELDSELLDWIEQRLWMIPLYPRHKNYDVLADTQIEPTNAGRLSCAADDCWKALLKRDASAVGKAMVESYEAQIAMFPHMITPDITAQIESYKDRVLGWKISGAGGGGYMIFFCEEPLENAIQIRIRR